MVDRRFTGLQESRDEGVDELVAYLNHRAVQCPGELFVLTGHSQGADVTGRALAELPSTVLDRIAFVAMFGDPRFQTYNLQVAFFIDQCYFPRPAWQRGTSECYSHGWYADDLAPYLPEALSDRAGSWCRDNDVACTGLLGDLDTIEEHTSYHTDGDVDLAMWEAAARLAEFRPDLAEHIDVSGLQFATGTAGADLAFVFDTTGSMSGEIDDVAAQATELAEQWLADSTNGRVALVEYRDHGDSFVSRVVQPLTDDPQAFQAALDGLVAAGGGDTPEAQLSGLMTTLNELDWQDGATKVAVVITDAPGKDPEPVTDFTRSQVSQRALEIDPVAIYGVAVFDDPDVTGFMQPLADGTAGDVFVLQPGQSLSDLLADVLDTVAFSPVAILHGPYFADVGQPVHFSAAGSFDPDSQLIAFEWDFDGDGAADQTTTTPTVSHTYAGAYAGIAAVRVVSADGGEALASTQVTVQAGGLASVAPVAPATATAVVTGPDEVTVTWTPAANDHADAYTVQLDGSYVFRAVDAGAGNSVTISGLDLDQPQTFSVRAANEYGQSPTTVTDPVGGGAAPEVAILDAEARFFPPPPCNPCPLSPAEGTVMLTGNGTATAPSGIVSVDVRLWGVLPGGSEILIDDWALATPSDGAFDSSAEAFVVNDGRDNEGYTDYDVDVRATAAGSSATVTVRVPIQTDTVAPTSSVDPLPASTTTSPIPIPVTASDNWTGPSTWMQVELRYRYRSKANQPWGLWTTFLTDSVGPYSFTFPFPNGKGFYQFYSIATDQSGNVEAAPASADASIQKK